MRLVGSIHCPHPSAPSSLFLGQSLLLLAGNTTEASTVGSGSGVPIPWKGVCLFAADFRGLRKHSGPTVFKGLAFKRLGKNTSLAVSGRQKDKKDAGYRNQCGTTPLQMQSHQTLVRSSEKHHHPNSTCHWDLSGQPHETGLRTCPPATDSVSAKSPEEDR